MLNVPVACAQKLLYTVVRNISDTEKFFGFLPANGKRLAAGEEIHILGHIENYLIELGLPDNRKRKSFEHAIGGFTDGHGVEHPPVLAIVKTPAVILWDETLDQSKIVQLNNGHLIRADLPCGYYSSSLAGQDGPH